MKGLLLLLLFLVNANADVSTQNTLTTTSNTPSSTSTTPPLTTTSTSSTSASTTAAPHTSSSTTATSTTPSSTSTSGVTSTPPPPTVISSPVVTSVDGALVTTVVTVTGGGSPSASTSSSQPTPTAPPSSDNSSSLSTGSIIGLSVAGGVAVIGLVAFFIWKLTRKRFSDFDDGEAIKWPDLNTHGGGTADSHPLPVHNTGRAGFDTGSETSLSRVDSISYSTPDFHSNPNLTPDPYAVPRFPSKPDHQPYRDDPATYYDTIEQSTGGYDPYIGSGTSDQGTGEVIPMTQLKAGGGMSPGPNVAYGPGPSGRLSPGSQLAYGGRASPAPQAAYGGRMSPGPQQAVYGSR